MFINYNLTQLYELIMNNFSKYLDDFEKHTKQHYLNPYIQHAIVITSNSICLQIHSRCRL